MASGDVPPFGALLKRYRQEAGLTQEALAARANVSTRLVSDLERGVIVRPRVETVHLLADGLGLAGGERAAFRSVARQHTDRPAPTVARGGTPNTMPVPRTPLIGRAAEEAAVVGLLRRVGLRVVTLSGSAGVGKTRLSLQVATALRGDFADGVVFVPLAVVTDPRLVVSAIAQELSVQEAGDRPLLESLVACLRDKNMLLLLDNFEQVVSAAPLVADLLIACPAVKVLVTSRTVLHLYGEQEFIVPPLALPSLHRLPEVETLAHYESVALFIQCAQLATPDFTVTRENAAAVAEICVRLDGLPLAIELAAARVKLLPPRALLLRLESRLSVLIGGAQDLPARQQTLRAAIDWSYNQLDEAVQTLFAWLSVFVGGCMLDAVEGVCARVGGLPGDVLDGLSSLVDKSLLRQEEDPTSGQPRFLMLETIREYARERLEQSGAAGVVRAAHAGYMRSLAEQAAPRLTEAEQGAWLARLEMDHDNLRTALRWAQESDVRTEEGLRIAGALWRFWSRRGYLSEGRRWLEAFTSPGQVSAQAASVEVAAVRATALSGAGNLATEQGDYARATGLHEESLALRRDLNDTLGIANSFNNLGNLAWLQGDAARAAVWYEESLVLRRHLRDTWGIATCLDGLGGVAYYQGDVARAQVLYEESLALRRELGDTAGLAHALGNLGEVVHELGDAARAQVLYEESLALYRRQSDKKGTATSLVGLGRVAASQGDAARARVLHEESLTLHRELGNKRGMAYSLEGLASVVATAPGIAPDALARAVRHLGAAAALRTAIGTALEPYDRARYERTVTGIRANLGAAAFAVAWTEGQAMTTEQAVAYALENRDTVRRWTPDTCHHGPGVRRIPW